LSIPLITLYLQTFEARVQDKVSALTLGAGPLVVGPELPAFALLDDFSIGFCADGGLDAPVPVVDEILHRVANFHFDFLEGYGDADVEFANKVIEWNRRAELVQALYGLPVALVVQKLVNQGIGNVKADFTTPDNELNYEPVQYRGAH